jgi:hypothetical protein
MAIAAREVFRFGTFTADGTARALSHAAGVSDDDLAVADEVHLSVETASIRFRMDGTDPTAEVGELVEAGGQLTVAGRENVQKLRIIAAGGSPVVSFHLLSDERVI